MYVLQERLDLLEQENDLLVSQQGSMDAELARLNRRLLQKEQEVGHGGCSCMTQHPGRFVGVSTVDELHQSAVASNC